MTPGNSELVLGAAAWRFASPGLLLLLLAVPIAGALLWLAFARQRRGLAVFAGATPMNTRPSTGRAMAKIALACAACALLILGIARPQADPIEEDATLRGRDIVFLVDVSRSMLARDVVPSRLERAKLWINDLASTLRSDRVALVAFAGVPVVKCPLTLDYPFFRMALDELSPASSPRGGTLIGDAIRKALSDVFEPGPARYRDVILITDGEDQGSFPVEAAKKAGELGVRVIALGIGGELEGSPVPAGDGAGFVKQDGQQVRSRLDSATLGQITQAAAQARGDGAGGVFLKVGTGTIDLDKVYQDLIASAEQRETQAKAGVVYRELFPYLFGLALLGLVIEPAIAWRSRARRGTLGSATPAGLAVAIALVLAVATPGRAQQSTPGASPAPADPATAYNTGRDLFLSGKYEEAAQAFRRADQGATDPELSVRSRFNLGQALLKQAGADGTGDASRAFARLDAAARAFKSVLAVRPDDAEAARNVEIARRLMQAAQDQQTQQQQNKGEGNPRDQKMDASKDQSSKDGKSEDQQAQEHRRNADQLKDLSRRQSQAADSSQGAQQERDPARRQAAQRQSQAQQDQVSQDTRQEQERRESATDASSPEARDRLGEARREQEAASTALQQGDAKSAEQHQREAAKLLDQASQAEQKAAQAAPSSQQRAGETQAEKDKPKDESPPRDQAAARLLDKERRQREARQQVLRALRGRPQPVEQDW